MKPIVTVPALNSVALRSGHKIDDVLMPSGKGLHSYVAGSPSATAAGTVMTGVIGPGAPGRLNQHLLGHSFFKNLTIPSNVRVAGTPNALLPWGSKA